MNISSDNVQCVPTVKDEKRHVPYKETISSKTKIPHDSNDSFSVDKIDCGANKKRSCSTDDLNSLVHASTNLLGSNQPTDSPSYSPRNRKQARYSEEDLSEQDSPSFSFFTDAEVMQQCQWNILNVMNQICQPVSPHAATSSTQSFPENTTDTSAASFKGLAAATYQDGTSSSIPMLPMQAQNSENGPKRTKLQAVPNSDAKDVPLAAITGFTTETMCMPIDTVASSTMNFEQMQESHSTIISSSKANNIVSRLSYANPPFPLGIASDEEKLSKFLSFVRKDCIEVFLATKTDLDCRIFTKKTVLNLNQVGIRCRFCSNLSYRERAGRSQSFPSSTSRIYQSVSMMVRDHFHNCQAMLPYMKDKFVALKGKTRQSSQGAKEYWTESALKLGLVDTPNGIQLIATETQFKGMVAAAYQDNTSSTIPMLLTQAQSSENGQEKTKLQAVPNSDAKDAPLAALTGVMAQTTLCMPTDAISSSTTRFGQMQEPHSTIISSSRASNIVSHLPHVNPPFPLGIASDEEKLSRFLSFVRKDCIEVFLATKSDLDCRVFPKKTILDQVGIRCRFCSNLPYRERAGRSQSFPSTRSRIYQSLIMMVRDHFHSCQAMPSDMKERFVALKVKTEQSTQGAKEYWVESALKLGLVDTPNGIQLIVPETYA